MPDLGDQTVDTTVRMVQNLLRMYVRSVLNKVRMEKQVRNASSKNIATSSSKGKLPVAPPGFEKSVQNISRGDNVLAANFGDAELAEICARILSRFGIECYPTGSDLVFYAKDQDKISTLFNDSAFEAELVNAYTQKYVANYEPNLTPNISEEKDIHTEIKNIKERVTTQVKGDIGDTFGLGNISGMPQSVLNENTPQSLLAWVCLESIVTKMSNDFREIHESLSRIEEKEMSAPQDKEHGEFAREDEDLQDEKASPALSDQAKEARDIHKEMTGHEPIAPDKFKDDLSH